MQAGALDRRLTLQRSTKGQDGFGAETDSWADLATVWAAKQDVRDSERVAAAEIGASITTRFQIRWRSDLVDLNPRDQALCEGRTYAIAAVKEIGRREGLEITATARAE